jgi:hypothetical protein
VTKDFSLGQLDTVQLGAFVVAATKETNASALAINEQRFAPSIKSVVAADEFGTVTEGNVAEFLKFIPGVSLDYVAADARSAQVRGMPSAGTAVTVDGMRVANSGSGSPGRAFEFDQLSINNVSRVEVTKGPTPDSPADAIGGTVNMVSKSAFERTRAEVTYRAVSQPQPPVAAGRAVHVVQQDARPRPRDVAQDQAGFRFHLCESGEPQLRVHVHRARFEHLQPAVHLRADVEPHQQRRLRRHSGRACDDDVSFQPEPEVHGALFVRRDGRLPVRAARRAERARIVERVRCVLQRPRDDDDPRYARELRPDVHAGAANGSITEVGSTRKAERATYLVNAKWRHDGPVWKFDASINTSRSKGIFRDTEDGWFKQVSLSQTALRHPLSTASTRRVPTRSPRRPRRRARSISATWAATR